MQITAVPIHDTKLPKSFHNYTIVQISDLHNANFGGQQKSLLTKIANCSPHLIAITGDLIDSNHPYLKPAMDFIHGTVTIAPVYYVTGNHEAWIPSVFAQLKQQMQHTGVRILEDEAVTVEK